jgi:hypothetical protein
MHASGRVTASRRENGRALALASAVGAKAGSEIHDREKNVKQRKREVANNDDEIVDDDEPTPSQQPKALEYQLIDLMSEGKPPPKAALPNEERC